MLETCLDKYNEKFFKSDAYLNSLFDEIADYLGKLVNCINDLTRIDDHVTTAEKMNQRDDEMPSGDDQTGSGKREEVTGRKEEERFVMTKSKKKFVQDNLNCLNRTVALARKSMIELVITSTMIGSLKQVISQLLLFL